LLIQQQIANKKIRPMKDNLSYDLSLTGLSLPHGVVIYEHKPSHPEISSVSFSFLLFPDLSFSSVSFNDNDRIFFLLFNFNIKKNFHFSSFLILYTLHFCRKNVVIMFQHKKSFLSILKLFSSNCIHKKRRSR
jgi:hypothetical protein